MGALRRSAGTLAAAMLLAVCASLLMLSVAISYDKKPEAVYAASGREAAAEPVRLQSGDIAVNRAELKEFMTLPGVGEAIGQGIIDERIRGGPYFYPEDLLAVRGIGPAKLAAIRDKLDFTEK